MNIFKISGIVAVDTNDAQKHLTDVSKKAQSSESTLTAAFKKIGSAVATYFATEKIVAFGKACIDTAAEVRASTAQFQQTFTVGGEDLTATAKNIIDTVAKDSGILATRLQDSGTKIYSFAKASGATSDEALSLMQDALTAAADTAAYYDTSLESATDTLQSFLKGNFANDAALGVSCTEFTRNAKATELFGKKYNDLTEIQKQQTLLKMVTDAQEVSGAMGQAKREADGWENVMGNLKEAWRQFQAVIGDPILENLIPIVQKLTEKVQKFPELFKTIKDQRLPEAIAKVKEKAQEVSDYLSSTFKPVIDDVNIAIDFLKGKFEEAKEKLQPLIDKFTEYVESGGLAEDATNTLKDVCQSLADMYVTVKEKIQDIINGFKDAVEWAKNHEDAVILLATAFGTLTTAIIAYNTARAISKAGGIVYLAQLAATAIGVGALTVAETAHTVATTIAAGATAAFGAVLAFVTSPITHVVLAIGALIAVIVLCVKHWDEIKAFAVECAQKISEKWQEFKETMSTLMTTLMSKILSLWESIKTGIVNKAKEIYTNVTSKFQDIKDSIATKLTEAKDKVVSIWETIKSSITEKIEAARDKVKSAIEAIKGFFNFKFTWPNLPLPHFSISPSGWTIGDLLKGSIPTLSVAWYAKGGILEDPTIFGMSGGKLLGGGEAGPEAVAPIDTLKQYVSEAVAAQNGGIVDALNKVADRLDNILDSMGDDLKQQIGSTSLQINNREFGRMVRAVT